MKNVEESTIEKIKQNHVGHCIFGDCRGNERVRVGPDHQNANSENEWMAKL